MTSIRAEFTHCFPSSVDHYSFVAKRYMYTALQHQPWTSITDWSNDTFRHELFKVLEKIINLSIDGQMGDIEGTERLIMIVLLPRYCPVHFNRCTRVDSLPVAEFKGDILLDGMKNLLTALQWYVASLLVYICI